MSEIANNAMEMRWHTDVKCVTLVARGGTTLKKSRRANHGTNHTFNVIRRAIDCNRPWFAQSVETNPGPRFLSSATGNLRLSVRRAAETVTSWTLSISDFAVLDGILSTADRDQHDCGGAARWHQGRSNSGPIPRAPAGDSR